MVSQLFSHFQKGWKIHYPWMAFSGFRNNWPPHGFIFLQSLCTPHRLVMVIIAFNYTMCTSYIFPIITILFYSFVSSHLCAFNFTFVLVLQLYFSRITAAAYTIVLYIRNCFTFVTILFVMISTLNSFSQISFHRGAGWGDTGRRKWSYNDKWEIFNRIAFNGKRGLIIRVNRVGMKALHGRHVIIFCHAFWWMISFHILINDVRYRKS
jgi:cellulose synthase/poly-beta-1,6-N-acetylglucosamine synthase-like glycosyltransferase